MIEQADPAGAPGLAMRRIVACWWPLAMSWLMMGAEMPMVAAVIGRLPSEEPNLAALAAIVYPVSILIEAPIIMLLAASTALVKDWSSYCKLRRFTHTAAAVLTAIHVVTAFTPLYGWLAREVIHAAEPVVEPGRIGLQIMTPWTWAIAMRRFQQGVLIRNERSRVVVAGTLVRLLTVAGILGVGLLSPVRSHFEAPLYGIVLGSLAIACGVLTEAVFIAVQTRPVLRDRVRRAAPAAEAWSWRGFGQFYVPLAMAPVLSIALQPAGAAAMNRMREPLASTACWSSVYGLIFLLRSAGFAFNEVVVALLGEPGAARALWRAASRAALAAVGLLLLIAVTPLGRWWFANVMDLSAELTAVAARAVGIGVLWPGYAMLQSYYQGTLVYARRTRAVTEAVVLYVVVSGVLLLVGVHLVPLRGIDYVLCAFAVAGIAQTLWLWQRSQSILRQLRA
ncbi:MAG: hypothetical protein KDC87_11800 [Planctomycetes bacterium]|nr:hypothetical protein [Planctomycetota bacterium]MCB9888168.1 hypothetical protein [Planctomycetota bacterium]